MPEVMLMPAGPPQAPPPAGADPPDGGGGDFPEALAEAAESAPRRGLGRRRRR